MRINDETRDFIALVRHHRFVEKHNQRQIGQYELRGDTFLAGLGGKSRQLIAAAQRRRLGKQRLQIGECVPPLSDRHAAHGGL